MRAITITGKHNIDKMNKVGDASYKAIREHMVGLNDEALLHKKQVDILRMLYLTDTITNLNDEKISMNSLILNELNHKIQGYKGQDKKKNIHNEATLINIDNVLEKLVSSMLTCYYCKKPIFVLYKNVREPFQWTLDRIDNSVNHTNENTCISCLKCNLQRRDIDVGKFAFTKKLKITKIDSKMES